MSWLRSWFGSGQSNLFTPLETQILDELGRHLPDAARTLLDQQIKGITLVQRLADGKEVNCYPKHGGAVRHDPTCQFPNRSEDLKLAVVRFRPSEVPAFKAECFAVDGYFFSILFSESPKRVASPVTITSVKVLADPLQPEANERQVAPIQFDGWLGDWDRRFNIQAAYVPLDEPTRARRLDEFDATFPPDHLELLQRTDGLDLEQCTVFSVREIREFAGDDANYYLIGEIAGSGMLAVREGSDDGAVFYLGFDQSSTRYRTLRDAVESICRSAADSIPRPR